MFGIVKRWIRNEKTRLAYKWLSDIGITPVRIVTHAGTNYIVKNDGALYRIGRVK